MYISSPWMNGDAGWSSSSGEPANREVCSSSFRSVIHRLSAWFGVASLLCDPSFSRFQHDNFRAHRVSYRFFVWHSLTQRNTCITNLWLPSRRNFLPSLLISNLGNECICIELMLNVLSECSSIVKLVTLWQSMHWIKVIILICFVYILCTFYLFIYLPFYVYGIVILICFVDGKMFQQWCI